MESVTVISEAWSLQDVVTHSKMINKFFDVKVFDIFIGNNTRLLNQSFTFYQLTLNRERVRNYFPSR